MTLSPGQLSTLSEMGIPVWELRSQQAPETRITTEQAFTTVQSDEQLLQRDWLLFVEQDEINNQTHRLLQAMMLAVGVDQHQFAVVSHEQLSQLQGSTNTVKVVMAFGAEPYRLLIGDDATVAKSRGKVNQIPNTDQTVIITFSLSELLQYPEHKVLAWHDLQLAKSMFQQSELTQ